MNHVFLCLAVEIQIFKNVLLLLLLLLLLVFLEFFENNACYRFQVVIIKIVFARDLKIISLELT